jgi:hypothetical protein
MMKEALKERLGVLTRNDEFGLIVLFELVTKIEYRFQNEFGAAHIHAQISRRRYIGRPKDVRVEQKDGYQIAGVIFGWGSLPAFRETTVKGHFGGVVQRGVVVQSQVGESEPLQDDPLLPAL